MRKLAEEKEAQLKKEAEEAAYKMAKEKDEIVAKLDAALVTIGSLEEKIEGLVLQKVDLETQVKFSNNCLPLTVDFLTSLAGAHSPESIFQQFFIDRFVACRLIHE